MNLGAEKTVFQPGTPTQNLNEKDLGSEEAPSAENAVVLTASLSTARVRFSQLRKRWLLTTNRYKTSFAMAA